MGQIVKIYNGAQPTTAAMAKVTTGAVIKTMLQVQASRQFTILEWGLSFAGFAAALPIQCELIETDVAATVTAHIEAGLVKYGNPDMDAIATEHGIIVGAGATGFTATVEGTTTASRLFDYQLIAPTGQYVIQLPLSREPRMNHDTFLRVRVTAGTAVDMICYVLLEMG